MIKIYCDICKEEQNDTDFAFEATVQELICDIDNINPMPNKRIKKTLIQVCKKCYQAHILPILNKNNAEG